MPGPGATAAWREPGRDLVTWGSLRPDWPRGFRLGPLRATLRSQHPRQCGEEDQTGTSSSLSTSPTVGADRGGCDGCQHRLSERNVGPRILLLLQSRPLGEEAASESVGRGLACEAEQAPVLGTRHRPCNLSACGKRAHRQGRWRNILPKQQRTLRSGEVWGGVPSRGGDGKGQRLSSQLSVRAMQMATASTRARLPQGKNLRNGAAG